MRRPIQNSLIRRALRPYVPWLPRGDFGLFLYGAKRYVGGNWRERGELQRNYLIQEGLQPSDHLIDFGCGCLRGGVSIASYLDSNRYLGIEPHEGLLQHARAVSKTQLREKCIRLVRPTEALPTDFVPDYIWVHSVFTHLTLEDIDRVLFKLARWCAPHTLVYASYFHGPLSPTNPKRSHDHWVLFLPARGTRTGGGSPLEERLSR